MAENAVGKALEVYVSKTEQELLNGEPNVLGLSTDQNTIVFNNKVVGSGSGVRYKKITLVAQSGWFRFAQANNGASNSTTAIFGIDRSYGSGKDEHYVFASSLNHAKNGYLTQLSGSYLNDSTHFIKKVRSAQNTGDTKPFYLDFYIESTGVNVFYVWVLGDWELLDITKVDEATDTANGITRLVEFETTNGFATSGDVNVAKGITAQGDIKANNFIGNLPDTLLYPKEPTALQCLNSPRLRSLNAFLRNNILSFSGSGLTAEYSIDGGETWVDVVWSDSVKNVFVSDGWENAASLKAGNGDEALAPQLKGARITYDFTAMNGSGVYGVLSDAIIYMKANNGTRMKVEMLNWGTEEWDKVGEYSMYSPDALPISVYLGSYKINRSETTSTSQYKAIRFTFSYVGTETKLTLIPFELKSMKMFVKGIYSVSLPNLARYGQNYSLDINQNIIIPNELYPSGHLSKNLGSNTKAYKVVYTRYVYAPSSYGLQLGSGATARWQIDTNGHYLPITTNKYNIGSASYLVNNIYANKFVGTLEGTADKATADSGGRNIVNSYQRVATPIFGGIMMRNGRTLNTSVYVGEITADKVFFLTDENKFAYYDESSDSFYYSFTNGVFFRDYSNSDGTPIADKLFITPNGDVYAFHNSGLHPIKAKSATKEYTTESISVDADGVMTCTSNSMVVSMPTSIINGTIFITQENGVIRSTMFPLSKTGSPTLKHPIKILSGTSWVDMIITAMPNATGVIWNVFDADNNPMDKTGLFLSGQITANFVEE